MLLHLIACLPSFLPGARPAGRPPARPPSSGGPSRAALRSAAVPGAGARDRSRRPRARPPAAGRLRSSSGPAGRRGPRRGGERGPPGPDAAGGAREATARRGAVRRGAQVILLTRCLDSFSCNIGHWFSLPSKDQNYSRNWRVGFKRKNLNKWTICL